MTSSIFRSVLTLGVFGSVGMASLLTAGPADSYEALKGFSCAQDGAARVWRPMAGSRAVSVATVEGKKAFRMPCNFHGTNIERASWDHPIEQDLAMCQGVQFMLHCADLSPVASFVCYLHSGDGWYRGVFDVPAAGRWTRIRIAKADMQVEGQPAGWSKIDTVRLSAWRGKDQDTQFHVTDFALFGTDTKIVIVRADSVAERTSGELGAVREYTGVMADLLERANLPYLVLSDLDVTAARLRATELVILPHNPAMPDEVAREIAAFHQDGGTLLACYHLPDALEPLVGIEAGRHMRELYDGYFASIRPGDEPLEGMPAVTQQASWNVHEARAVGPDAHVAAWWYTKEGRSTETPAIVVGERCVYLSHVLRPDDPANKLQLLLAMAGHLVPSLWSDAAQGCLDRVGRFGPYQDYKSAQRGIAGLDAGSENASAALEKADRLYHRSQWLLSKQEYGQAMVSAEEAHRALIEAYCLAQQPVAGEHRAFWCHSAFGVAGMTWDEAARRLGENGFTAVLPNMLWGGVAFYRSDVLPAYKDLESKGDQIELCVAACKKYGVQCHVWKVNYNMGWATDKAFVERMRSLGRVQVSYDGTVNERWLCPSHPDNQKLEIESMLEVARKYDVDGLHFDYIRYPGRDGCFCEGCRQRFEDYLGRKAEPWPSVVRDNARLAEKWLEFRRSQITSVVAAVAARARQVRPDVQISAAVFRNWPTDRDTVGQDWKLWCDKGYLDFVCPMDYFDSSATFERAVEQQLDWAGDVPCYPGIGLSVWKDPTDVAKLIEQINITRRFKTGGFTIFNYGPPQAGDVLPLLGKGLTRVEE